MQTRRRALRWGSLLLLVAAVATAGTRPAQAVVPETAVGGANSRWFSGSLIQQPGTNCSILGGSYSEVMVSAIGSYGGRPGTVKVGDQYWAQLLLAIPGNPCGPGSSGVVTDLILPKSTQIDTSRPIRCFFLSRGQPTQNFEEVTGQSWQGLGQSGKICPAVTELVASGYTPGVLNIGYRLQASGTMLSIFVPVKSTGPLLGTGGPDKFSWVTHATGVYANPGLSEVWANVFNGVGGDTPFVYFARTPSAIPFWKADAPSSPQDLRNRVEFFANFYVAGKPGTVSFEIRRTDTNQLVIDSTSPAAGFNGTVPAGNDLIQLNPAADARGPNGGYAPFAFDPPHEWNVPMTITWRFTPTTGAPVTGSQSFRTLSGPDADGDGVSDAADACPAVKGTGADGCLPPVPTPAPAPPAAPAPNPAPGAASVAPGPLTTLSASPRALQATFRGVRKGTRWKASALRRGVRVAVTCTSDAAAKVTLSVEAKTGRRLGLKRGAPLATASGRCTASRGGAVTLKVARRLAAKLRRPVAATLNVSLTAPGAASGGAKLAVKVG